MNKLVSVIIPTYQRNEYLKKAILSVLNQTYSPFEIIVVDDNSNYELSREVVCICKEHQVFYLKNNRQKGGCGARNSGILASHGDYIAFLDDDDAWLPSKLQAQIDLLGCYPDCVACFCSQYDFYEQKNLFTKPVAIKSQLSHVDILNGECPSSTSLVLVRKSAIVKTELFDECLQSFQDYDMWLSLTQHGDMVGLNQGLSIMRHHLGERTSVSFAKRIDGLGAVFKKWGLSSKDESREVDLNKLFRFSLYYKNGIYSRKYINGVMLKCKAMQYAKINAKNIMCLVLAVFGNDVYWRIVGFRKGVKNEDERQLLQSIIAN